VKRSVLRGSLLLGALLLPGGRAAGQAFWQPDERVVISDFTRVVGVAADAWRVMAATEHGLLLYDPLARTWQAPLTIEDGYPVPERPTSLGWIERAHTLLLGTWTGSLWRIDVEGRRIERLAQLPGAVLAIRGDAEGNAYLGTRNGWFRLPPGSFSPEPAAAPPAERGADDPILEAMRGQLGVDRALRRWPVTSQAAGRLAGEYYIGTDGGGLARVDTRMQSVEWLPFGITTRGGGAIGMVGGRLWLGGDGTERQRPSLVSATPALQDWLAAEEGDAPRGAVTAIVEQEGTAWVGTSDGLFRYDRERRAWRRFDDGDGLPTETVRALLADGNALWVATSRGFCRFEAERCGPNLLPAQPVHALAACGGRVWAAARNGLFTSSGSEAARPASLARTRTRVQDVACIGERVFAATLDQLLEQRPDGWQERVVPRPQGALHSLVSAAGELWIGADRWVGRWDAASGEWSHYIVPSDVPHGPIQDILPLPSALWLVTPGGMVRLDLQPQ
jgi:ligand-binding sensor domain-containing protein